MIVRLLKFGDVAYGYDVGIYRHFIAGYGGLLSQDPSVPFGFAYLSSFLLKVGFSLDAIQFGWYVAVFLGIVALWYSYLHRAQGRLVALVGSGLLATSLVLFEVQWWYYYRQAVAMLFFLLVVYVLERKKYGRLVFGIVGIGTVHVISLVPLFFYLLGYLAQDRTQYKPLLLSGGAAVVLTLFINWSEYVGYIALLEGIGVTSAALSSIGRHEFSGQFLPPMVFLQAVIFYIPLSVLGMVRSMMKQVGFFVLLIGSGIVVVSDLVFSHRLFPYIDLALIYFAAIEIKSIVHWLGGTRVSYVLLVCFMIGVGGQWLWYITKKVPHIPLAEVVAIEQLPLEIDEPVLSFSSYYAPWLYGYTHGYVIAPGMLDDTTWNYDDWLAFWQTEESAVRQSLFQRLPDVSGKKYIDIYVGTREIPRARRLSEDRYCGWIQPTIVRCRVSDEYAAQIIPVDESSLELDIN